MLFVYDADSWYILRFKRTNLVLAIPPYSLVKMSDLPKDHPLTLKGFIDFTCDKLAKMILKIIQLCD